MFDVDVCRSHISIIHSNLNKIKPHEFIRTFSHEHRAAYSFITQKALLSKQVEPTVEGDIEQRTVTPGDGMMDKGSEPNMDGQHAFINCR